jgi:hypothetical protein
MNLFKRVSLALNSPTTLVFFGLLLFGLAMRIWGVWFGLPHLFHNDEGFEVIRALQLGSGEFDFDRIAKGGYFYLLFVEYGFLFVALKLSGVINSANDFALYFISDPSAFYLIGRITTAVIGVVNVYLVYRIGRLFYSPLAGVIAAAFLSVNVLHVGLSHYVTVDVPMTCLATGALLFAIKLSHDGKPWDYRWAAILAAMATATKIPAVLLVIPLAIAHWLYFRSIGKSAGQALLSGSFWQAAALFVFTYVLLSPGILFNFGDLFAGMFGNFTTGEGLEAADDVAAMDAPNFFVFYFENILSGMTLPVFAVCMAGALFGLWKRSNADIILLSFAIIIYVVVSSSADTHLYYPRYILPMMPVMVLMGGRLLAEMPADFSPQRGAMISTVLTAALCILPVRVISAENHLMSQPDTRVLAKEWIHENIPPGSSIFIEGPRTRVSPATVPLENSAKKIQESIDYFLENEPGKARYFQMKLKVLSGITYDLELVQSFDLQDIEHYRSIGVEYLVLRPDSYVGSRLRSQWADFVDEVRKDQDITMIRRFEPDDKETPGPVIEIYRID